MAVVKNPKTMTLLEYIKKAPIEAECDIRDSDYFFPIRNQLPHGSGINFDYYVESKKANIIISCAYHYMDEYGFYDYVIPFSVHIKRAGVFGDFRIVFHTDGKGYYRIMKAGLRDYLAELYCYELNKKYKETTARSSKRTVFR